MLRPLPTDTHWSITAVGRHQRRMLALAILRGAGGIRVGFEDGVYLRRGELASSNAELVADACTLVETLGRRVATIDEARELLACPARYAACSTCPDAPHSSPAARADRARRLPRLRPCRCGRRRPLPVERSGGGKRRRRDPGPSVAGAETVQADVTRPEEVRRVFAGLDQLHVLFNNAGVYPPGALDSLTVEEWDEVFAVNARGPFLVTQAALPLLTAADEARVVNIGTIMAHRGGPGNLHYAAAKSSLIGLTRVLARELAPRGITVNMIVPSMVGTGDGGARLPGDLRRDRR